MEITVKDLIELLTLEDQKSPVYFGGLDFYRIKDRGGCVQIEFNQTVFKDEYSLVQIQNHTISYITAYDPQGNPEKFLVREQEFQPTDDCNLTGFEYLVFTENQPLVGFIFQLLFTNDQYYIKYVDNNDLPHVSGKGIVRAMLIALSRLVKKDIYSSTNMPSQKIYESEGLVPKMQAAWNKWKTELPNVEYLSDKGRFVFKYCS